MFFSWQASCCPVRSRIPLEGGHLRFARTGYHDETETFSGTRSSRRSSLDSSTKAHSGLGLGPALVKRLTEPLRGPAPGAPAAALGTGIRLDGLRVLAVDDDPDALELTAAILGNAGALVKTCCSAAAALQILQEWRPDVLVSDIEMPGEDGYSLIRKIRALADDRDARTPAIALTAYGRIEDRIQALSSGFSMHLPKPVDPEEFTTIIASVARVFRPPTRLA